MTPAPDEQPLAPEDGPGSRLFGLETEYGLWIEGRGPEDLMEEARGVVMAYSGRWAGPWDYRLEDPRRDLRGFRVDRLRYDEADARYDRHRPAYRSASEERADRVLPNGARLYNDHGHPEYATPECRTLRQLVAHDRAGERIVLRCARRRHEETGREVRLFKNNTDFHGSSYGCHESYLCHRSVPFERLLHGLLPFLVTRILYAGAGKVGAEAGAAGCAFQLSQRADFFTEAAGVDTLAQRPIFNTRDEPHADPRRFRRLHVICGDANMSEFATALKVGATSLALSLIEAGWEPPFRLRDPVRAIQSLSRDPAFEWLVELEDGRRMPALAIQRTYLDEARRLLGGANPETDWTLREWDAVLNDLEIDPRRAEDRVDWVAKRRLLETYREAEGVDWDSEALRSLDLAYHDLDPETGLFAALEGQMRRLVTEPEIERATEEPPLTRAALRGEMIRRFGDALRRLNWERLVLDDGIPPGAEAAVRLPAELDAATVAGLLSGIRGAKTVREAAAILAAAAPRQSSSGDSDEPGSR